MFQRLQKKSLLSAVTIGLRCVSVLAEVRELIQKCLAVQPGERPTIEDLAEHRWMQTATQLPMNPPELTSDRRSIDETSTSSRESI